MNKISLRPLRLTHMQDVTLDNSIGITSNSDNGDENENGRRVGQVQLEHPDGLPIEEPAVTTTAASELDTQPLPGDTAAHHLLQRTPHNYLFNQIYGFWLYLSLFLLTLIITHTVSTKQYGVFAAIQTAINTILYIVAFGLEDATATFVPRIFAEHGQATAASLLRRILTLRLLILALGMCIILFGLPVLATLLALVPIKDVAASATSLRDPVLLAHTWPVAVYVLGSGIANLLMAVCAAFMRMLRVLIVGGAMQLALLGLGYLALHSGWGIDGVLWMQAIASLLGAAAFACWLAPQFLARGATYKQPLKPILQLGISAWVTNLVSGALLKQVSILLLLFFAARLADTAVAYFNLSFQVADATNVLLVSGFSGVGASALAAAFVGRNYERFARTWQALIKVETLIAAPGLVFCLFNASNIVHVLYGSRYDAVGPLLAIFLGCNILVRILGSAIHQSGLYVIGKPGLVVLSQWVSLCIVILVGIVLVPQFGAAGALIADGLAKTVTAILLLLFILRSVPRQYPRALLTFTLRFLPALIIAALPGILWHPTDRILLGVSGALFVALCLVLLLVIKPLSASDIEMITATNPRVAPYLRRFARRSTATGAV